MEQKFSARLNTNERDQTKLCKKCSIKVFYYFLTIKKKKKNSPKYNFTFYFFLYVQLSTYFKIGYLYFYYRHDLINLPSSLSQIYWVCRKINMLLIFSVQRRYIYVCTQFYGSIFIASHKIYRRHIFPLVENWVLSDSNKVSVKCITSEFIRKV